MSCNQLKVLEFCRLIGRLKHMKRTGWVKRQVTDPEPIAGHMYRMAILAFVLDDKQLNRDRCIKMALVHDMAECIAGDITPTCGVSEDEKFKLEKEGFDQICALVPPSVGTEMLDLWLEYEGQQTLESKAVKDLDKFDMIAQAHEYETDGSAPSRRHLQEFFDNTTGVFQTDTVKGWVNELHQARGNTVERQE